ncbi:chlorophyll synthase ChlG [Salinarimonas ramus]|uniref:Bacteriochlorophyll/chlorophyll a synthase n=1 Tax=Salinarimonas ramus TaxID=690164 RepID=A0A917QKA0_9HYPH|nr:chlorophyll synthase ChlG [Salinarimonas ramus]GGK55077.1 bacteriochlorophyll/chlorophyll a synthase [Salinarimonas ramus]
MTRPAILSFTELLKPITWFAPMWAFACGVVSSGVAADTRWPVILAGIVLAGPLVCAASQAVNDWYDRHVDAINEPNRPIPSGRIPGRWGLYIAVIWTALSALVAFLLGPVVLLAGIVGLALAWAYSAPPFRLKQNGWWGNSAVAISYEGLPWFTGAAIMAAAFPDWRIVVVALLYSFGAHGIMTLNDFKSVEGDTREGVDSLPVLLGVDRAARLACWVMAAPQVVVIALLFAWGAPWHALAVTALLAAQAALMGKLVADPRGKAAWYNATGTTLYVLGMLVTAFALRGLGPVA